MAIAFDNCANLSDIGGTRTSYNCTHVMSAAPNGVLILGMWHSKALTNLAATYNSVAMTQVSTTFNFATSEYLSVFALLNPSTGSNTCTVSFDSNNPAINSYTISYTGVSQSGFPDNSKNTNTVSATTSITDSLTTVADSCWVVMFSRNDNNTFTAGSGSTLRNQFVGAGVAFADSNGPVTPAGSYSMSLSWPSNGKAGDFMLSLAPFVATAATPRRTLLGVGI